MILHIDFLIFSISLILFVIAAVLTFSIKSVASDGSEAPLYKHYVTDIKKIFRNYLWNGFIPNFIYVFPFYLFNHNLEIIRILKIYRYPFISNKSKESLSWILSFIFKKSV